MDRLLRFLTVGVANTAIGLSSIFAAMRFLDMSEAAANALGYAIGVTLSFVVNRAWTFGDGARASLAQLFGVPVHTGVGFLGARHYALRDPATLLQEA